jgi:flagella basal body P-ring formation protein FlgA
MILFFLPIFLFGGVIENNISKVYKETYPTITIEHITIKNYKNQKIKYIDTSNINPKRKSGTIKINNSFVFYTIDANIKVLKSIQIINKNDPITPHNAKLTTIKFKNFYAYPMTYYPKKIAKQYIPTNKIIYKYMLKDKSAIKKGQIIEVISKSGGIEVTFREIDMQNGKIGDTIKVKKDKQVFFVTIDKNGNGRL